MFTTVKGILKGNKIILEENIPSLIEQNILLTFLDQPTIDEKKIILSGIEKGLQDKEHNDVISFDESLEILERLVEL